MSIEQRHLDCIKIYIYIYLILTEVFLPEEID